MNLEIFEEKKYQLKLTKKLINVDSLELLTISLSLNILF